MNRENIKKIIANSIIILTAITPFFRGLFYLYESSAFLAAFGLLSTIYFIIKLRANEPLVVNKLLSIIGLLLITAYIISFTKAVSVRENISTLIQYIEYLVLFIILYDYYHDKKNKFGWIAMSAVTVSGFINAIIGIEAISAYFSSLKNLINDDRVGATFEYTNTAGIYFAVCLMFALTLINLSNSMIIKVALTGIGNTVLLALLQTGSRGSYIAVFVVMLIFFAMQPPKYRFKTIGSFIALAIPAIIFSRLIFPLTYSLDYIMLTKWMAFSFVSAVSLGFLYELLKKLMAKVWIKAVAGTLVLLVLAAAIAITIHNNGFSGIIPESIISRFATFGINDINVFYRLSLDKWGLKIISDNWLLGLGGDGWNALYQSVQDYYFTARDAHNNYLQVFIESGILGILSYIAVIVVSIWYLIRSRIKSTDFRDKVSVAGLFGGIAAIAFHSSFDFDLSFMSMTLLFWMLIAGSAIFLPQADKKEATLNMRGTLVLKKKAAVYFIVCICAVLFSINCLYTASSFYDEIGLKNMDNQDFQSAMSNYTKARGLDPINPYYDFQLAKIYNLYADHSTKPEKISMWRKEALAAAKKSVALNGYYPVYREVLVRTCLDLNMPLEALDNVELLIKFQPCNSSNYELLARSYLAAANYYIENNNSAKGKELLLLCSEVEKNPFADKSDALEEYQKQAKNMLKKF